MCLAPFRCSLPEDGGRPTPDSEGNLLLPCGKCSECISKRASDWALRAQHEISLHKESCFLTLTYDDDNLPSIYVVKDEFQKFLKRLRSKIYPRKIGYMVSHEYGTLSFRPHHHVLIFGYSPSNYEFLRTTKKGSSLFTSEEISELWKHGFHSIGDANAKTAYYIAAYALKGKTHELIDPVTGEFVSVSDSFDCSKRPGIGLEFLKKNALNLINAKKILPRYYLKKLADFAPDLLELYENEQLMNLKLRGSHQIYAKFKISQARRILCDQEFRSAPISDQEKAFESYLKHDL